MRLAVGVQWGLDWSTCGGMKGGRIGGCKVVHISPGLLKLDNLLQRSCQVISDYDLV